MSDKIDIAVPMITDLKNKIVQLLVIEGGLPVGVATNKSKNVFKTIDTIVAELEGRVVDTKTKSLFEECVENGRNC